MADAQCDNPLTLQSTHPKVGVVGGTGGTGAQFARLLAASGFEVRVSGRKTELSNFDLAQQSDFLIFAPPLKHALQIIEETVPYCQREEQLVVDLCSTKVEPMRAMAKAKGRVIGLHPLFGPKFEDLKGQDLVLCQEPELRDDPLYASLCAQLRALGLTLHEMTATEHDSLMATIQVIPHLGALINGHLFRSLGIDAAKSLQICSPVYKTELYMIGRIHSQNPALYASIIAQNPHSAQVVQELAKIVETLRGHIEMQDQPALEAVFQANKEHLGEFSDVALRESQRLLDRN